ncbi:MAG TPA: hypothetical protein PLI18_03910 [Pirellulaceae bacterium]|nr:hypothetical protein [Pirellulaceae bacterium]
MSFGLRMSLVLIGCAAAAAPAQDDPYFRRPPVGQPAAQPVEASPVSFFPKRSFSMPVTVHDRDALELRLFVSADRGQSWNLHSRSRPDVRSLSFEAPQDGEYWFALHTITSANASQEAPFEFVPALRLLIDSQRPVLDAEAFPGAGGGVGIRYAVRDSHLDPATMTLEYRAKVAIGPQARWLPLTVPPPATPGEDPLQRTIQVWPETSQRVIEVRLSVADRAGNVTSIEREVTFPWVADAGANRNPTGVPEADAGTTTRQAAAQELQGPRNVPWVGNGEGALRGETIRDEGVRPAPVAGPPAPPPGYAGSDRSGSWGTTVPRTGPAATSDPVPLPPIPPTESSSIADTSGTGSVPARPVAERFSPTPPAATPPAPSPLEPAVEELPPPLDEHDVATPSRSEGRGGSSFESINHGSSRPNDSFRPDGMTQLTGERRFRLAYDVDSVGRAGVAKVQLWITEDGGTSWHPSTEDPDCESPIDVELPGEGTFGFHLVVTARNGLAGEAPSPGQEADMWVTVDRTVPEVRLIEAPLGSGDDHGRVLIRWEASDEHLGKRPVTLQYAETLDGPWETFAASLPNTGHYAWTIVPSLPRRLYLRVEVKDRAGNLGHAVSPLPIDLGSLVPRGTLRGVVGNSGDE